MSLERNIEPTPLKRLQAKQQGRFPRHGELAFLLTLALLLAIAFSQSQSVWEALGGLLRNGLETPARLALNVEETQQMGQTALRHIVNLVAWPAFIGLVGVLGFLLFQGGWVWLPDRVTPDLARLHPAHGIKRSTGDLGRHLLFVPAKYLIGILVGLGTLWVMREQAYTVAREDLTASLGVSGQNLFSVILAVLAALMIVACLEYAFRLRQYHRSLRMTEQEARDEASGRAASHVDSLQAAGDANGRRGAPPRRLQAATGSDE